MGSRLILSVTLCAALGVSASAAGQAPAARLPAVASAQAGQAYVPPRTADGHPDVPGVWRVWNLATYDVEPHGASPRTGNVLTITKTETPDGVVTNERAVFDRDQP